MLVLAACQAPGATPLPSTVPSGSPQIDAPPATPSPDAFASAHDGHATPAIPTVVADVIGVTLSDAIRIEPAQMSVTAGTPVIFRVTNAGVLAHEFYVGDEAAQAAHEAEMLALGGTMPHDTPTGIAVQPGETKDLTLTFPTPGELIAGCHVLNHYSGGMRATITVAE